MPKLRTFDAMTSLIRARFQNMLGLTHGGKRNLYEVFGYPQEITADMLYMLYVRGGIAARIIRQFPQSTWRDEPIIRDLAGSSAEQLDPRGRTNKSYSPFCEAVEDFFEKYGLWRVIERADRVSSIGRFGIILLGFDDSDNLASPLRAGKSKLLYASPYGEPGVQVTKWDSDPKSARFGMPEQYQVNQSTGMLGSGAPSRVALSVHWSRVIHIAEFLDSDDCYGVPRLLPVYNHLMDLEKVTGGAAETFWLAANRGLALWTEPEATLDEEEIANMKKQAEEFQHQLRRTLVGSGMRAEVLGADAPDSGPTADRLIDLISGTVGMPKRILLGTERGELSSSQDESNWSSRIDERRRNFASPMILKPLVQRLIATGNLPEPEGMFWVEWPDVATLDPVQRSTVVLNKTNALTNYVRSPGVEFVVPMQEFRREFLELEEESEFDMPDELDPLPEDEEVLVDEENDEPQTNTPGLSSLYIHRRVLNAEAIRKWARSQGITDLVKDLHVTVLYSEKEVDWMECMDPKCAFNLTVDPQRRVLEQFDGGAIVLRLMSPELSARHDELVTQRGAEHSYPQYIPHLTITYGKPAVDLSKIKPYNGAIVLGPEKYDVVRDISPEDR